MFKPTDMLQPNLGSSATAAPSKVSAKDLIEQVSVTLEAYVGEAAMSVADLRALKAGETIELDASLNSLVALKLNGATVAAGELVAVGEKFAVRITDLG